MLHRAAAKAIRLQCRFCNARKKKAFRCREPEKRGGRGEGDAEGGGRDGVRQERDYVVKTDVRRRPAVVPIGR